MNDAAPWSDSNIRLPSAGHLANAGILRTIGKS
jgi:hypothetical protein